jgi:hypothetical protein
MTLQGNLRMEFNNRIYELSVKSILLKGIYYFFIHNNDKDDGLLSGETLQFVYDGQLQPPTNSKGENCADIPPEIIKAIESVLLENKQLWNYT